MPRALSRRGVLAGGGAALAAAAVGLPGGTAHADPKPSAGDRLYRLVEEYGQWDSHQTGTPGGTAAVDWLHRQLRSRGATVRRHIYTYERYVWDAEVRIAGRRVDAVPYFYEGTGTVRTSKPFTRAVTLTNGVGTEEVTAALGEADAAGADLVVLATSDRVTSSGTYAGLLGINSAPDRPRTGIPTLLVSGSEAEALAAGPVDARVRARRVAAEADNLVARFGPEVPDPVVITTPVSGWFHCAAERGPGIALALELAERLHAAGDPVLFVSTSGHELENLGLIEYLQTLEDPDVDFRPRAVLHLGASLAAGVDDGSGGLTLAPARYAVARPALAKNPELKAALATAAFAAATSIPAATEAYYWAQYVRPTVPLLSLSGVFPQFHSPADLAAATTSPALLATVQSAIDTAVDLVLKNSL